MMASKLFLFSDHGAPASLPLDAEVLAATGKANPSVAWIPSGASPERTDEFFARRCDYYASIGVHDVRMFCLHRDFHRRQVDEILRCDIVHLSAGDAFVFLKNLRATGFVEALRERALAGGVTVGDCGGAMLMAPDIEMCRFGHIPVPDDLTDLAALGLVDFEIHPHFGSYGATLEQLHAYAKRKRRIVYAIADGGGLSVIGDEISTHGTVVRIFDGEAQSDWTVARLQNTQRAEGQGTER